MEIQQIKIEPIMLRWSPWVRWESIKVDGRTRQGIHIPNKKSGVYEVKYAHGVKRLTIGKASNLRYRIRQALVKGKGKHTAGSAIRRSEKVGSLVVRWAETMRPSAVEEELHRLYRGRHGELPKHTRIT